VSRIANSLQYNVTLTTLNLRVNKIGYSGIFQIANSLRYNTTLTTLNLSGNRVVGALYNQVKFLLLINISDNWPKTHYKLPNHVQNLIKTLYICISKTCFHLPKELNFLMIQKMLLVWKLKPKKNKISDD